MKMKNNMATWASCLILIAVMCLTVIAVLKFGKEAFGLPAEDYAPGLYRVGIALQVDQWHDIGVGGYFFPACALMFSDGYTYLTVDPDMTTHCGAR